MLRCSWSPIWGNKSLSVAFQKKGLIAFHPKKQKRRQNANNFTQRITYASNCSLVILVLSLFIPFLLWCFLKLSAQGVSHKQSAQLISVTDGLVVAPPHLGIKKYLKYLLDFFCEDMVVGDSQDLVDHLTQINALLSLPLSGELSVFLQLFQQLARLIHHLQQNGCATDIQRVSNTDSLVLEICVLVQELCLDSHFALSQCMDPVKKGPTAYRVVVPVLWVGVIVRVNASAGKSLDR